MRCVVHRLRFDELDGEGATLGGIYGRPVVIGNLVHFIMGALLLMRMPGAPTTDPVKWLLFGTYAILAGLFGVVMFTHPGKST